MENMLRSNDRVLVLAKMEGKDAKGSTGLVDPRILSGGDNRVHVIQNEQDQLWSFKYEKGAIPEDMKQRFTSFPKALAFAKSYYNKRNIEVTEVKD